MQGSDFAVLDAVTFGDREVPQRCAAELGYQSYEQLVSTTDGRSAHAPGPGADRAARAHRQRVVALPEEHGNPMAANNFEGQLAQTLRTELGNALFQQDLRSVHMRIRAGATRDRPRARVAEEGRVPGRSQRLRSRPNLGSQSAHPSDRQDARLVGDETLAAVGR
jgi:hypothetical protein